ncbi:hypothetical protein ACF0H5_016542 [Mactra antiquata]
MSDVDELDVNPFFLALQSKFSSVYEKALKECCLFCIPQSDCLQGAVITDKFVDTHILKPSPFFKGQYHTIRSESQIASIDDNGEHITTLDGFPTKTAIKILNEELGYNKNYQPYKMLIIARPLDQNVLRKRHVSDGTSSGEFNMEFTVDNCKEFLKSIQDIAKAIQELDEQINKFIKNYILLKDYLDDAAQRLCEISTSVTEKSIRSMKTKGNLSNKKFRDNITAAVETCLIGSVHQKLYPTICSKCNNDDVAMVTKCRNLQGLSTHHLGVPKHFSCPLTSAVVELAHLDGLITPIEKLYCMKTTIDNITEDINKHVRETQPLGLPEEDIPCLTSDELIPILVTVIVQAKCNHIHSDIYYIDNFYWSAANRDRESLSYCLVTFKAAVQYMMTTDFSDIDLKGAVQNEISFDKIIESRSDRGAVKMCPESSMKSEREVNGAYIPSSSRFDRQMENISRMLDESTKEMGKKSNIVKKPIVHSIFGGPVKSVSPLPDEQQKKDKTNKDEDMGDFLSSLNNEFLSFGKQT